MDTANIDQLARNVGNTTAPEQLAKLVYPVRSAVAQAGLPETHLWGAISRKEPRAIKAGRETLVTRADLLDFLASLPEAAA
jgi:hypothetical protein